MPNSNTKLRSTFVEIKPRPKDLTLNRITVKGKIKNERGFWCYMATEGNFDGYFSEVNWNMEHQKNYPFCKSHITEILEIMETLAKKNVFQ